ncbi:histidine phosphatase family protein [Phycicoccus sp.]|uniref:histidine phosphatase family protein n=1 Tax=Phycicoccus sp. TaxID=1902410 RepID=UPI002C17E9AC|nr:histidine phosphatase family protein [Phycicoccus sp.]HMM96632.1 histidine phosphatase family protein [Phycicoccus sp.]
MPDPSSPPPPTTAPGWPSELVLVRHGESVGNLAAAEAGARGLGRLDLDYRDPDTPLSDTGLDQARALGRALAGRPPERRPEVVLASPYARALTTARCGLEPIASAPPVTPDERARERDLGLFDGLTGSGIRELHPEEAERRDAMGKFYYRPPGGESWVDVVLRVRSLLRDLRTEHPGRRVWVFTHQAVIMSFRYVLESMTEEELLAADHGTPLANCSLTTYRGGPHGPRLEAYGSVEHLEEGGSAPTTHEDAPPAEGEPARPGGGEVDG